MITFMRARAGSEIVRYIRTEVRRRKRELAALRERPQYQGQDGTQPVNVLSEFFGTLSPREQVFCSEHLLGEASDAAGRLTPRRTSGSSATAFAASCSASSASGSGPSLSFSNAALPRRCRLRQKARGKTHFLVKPMKKGWPRRNHPRMNAIFAADLLTPNCAAEPPAQAIRPARASAHTAREWNSTKGIHLLPVDILRRTGEVLQEVSELQSIIGLNQRAAVGVVKLPLVLVVRSAADDYRASGRKLRGDRTCPVRGATHHRKPRATHHR